MRNAYNRRFTIFPLTVLSSIFMALPLFAEEAKDKQETPAGGNLLNPGAPPAPAGGNLLNPAAPPAPAGGNLLNPGAAPAPAGGNLLNPGAAPAPAGGNLLNPGGDSAPSLLPPKQGGSLLNPGGGPSEGDLLKMTPLPPSLLAPPSGDAPKTDEDEGASPLNKDAEQLHAEVIAAAGGYPTAADCGKCHQQVYFEWSISNHAYASLSPMFNKFEQKLNELTQGTVGYFCMRCHSGVGTTLGEDRTLPPWEKAAVSHEGITCITCHRVDESYGRVNGERRIVEGDISNPVYGGIGGDGVAKAISEGIGNVSPEFPNPKGKRSIHSAGIRFEQIDKSEFCVSCHQVAVHPGIKLEVVWEQYRASPAAKAGVTCQDCHMGKVPGRAEGYETGPAAIIGGKVHPDGPERVNGKLTGKVRLVEQDGKPVGDIVNPNRKHSNHAFWGPGYPIDHPGIFPHNWTAKNDPKYDFAIKAWLTFDWRAGWGEEAFERRVLKGEIKPRFPEEWSKMIWRRNARVIVNQNLATLELKRDMRRQVMENGSRLDGPYFMENGVFSSKPKPTEKPLRVGETLKFYYKLTNTDEGHNLPSGSLGAQPEIWLNVALIDPNGKNIWESGYVDSQGDMCDLHSGDVHAGKIPHDSQLFNLQTKFLSSNLKGTDREVYLPAPFDADPLPMLRPAGQPVSVLNHPPTIRMEGRSIPPHSSRKAEYKVPGKLLKSPGTYRLLVRLRSRAEPIYFMKYVGASPEMIRSMNEWMLDFHAYAVEFEIR